MPTHSAATVDVGPFPVADLSRVSVVDHVVDLAMTDARERAVTAFALHVHGLVLRDNPAFVWAMQSADLVYADGGSIVWLAARAGAQHVERAPTTDIGWDVLHGLAAALGRPPKVALVGGTPGLARQASQVLKGAAVAEPVFISHGYHTDWTEHLDRLRASRPDIVLVGMGAPVEMLWAQRWADRLPPSLILTCGGWFGFLAGEERRAPKVIRRPGLEWVSRVAQSPGRLGPRYVKGALATASLARSTRPASTVLRPTVDVRLPAQRTPVEAPLDSSSLRSRTTGL